METTSITTNILTNLSDASLKKDVEDLDGLEIIRRLSSKKYRWKENDKAAMGFIAQQVQSEFMQDFPSLVHENPETGLLSVDYIAFIPALVDAVQQLEARIEELESK